MLFTIIVLAVALLAISYSADKFVSQVSLFSEKLGVSPAITSAILIGFGTSSPEISVSWMARAPADIPVAIGNALGSNIINLGLILSLLPFALSKAELTIKTPTWMLVLFSVSSLLLTIMMLSGTPPWVLAGAQLTCLGCYLALLYRMHIEQSAHQREPSSSTLSWSDPIALIFWLAVILLSAHALVRSASALALTMGVPNWIIGLTLVAVGTSLPELASAIATLRKRAPEMLIGTIIGSNIFNLTAVLLPLTPLTLEPRFATTLRFDGLYMMIMTLLCHLLLANPQRYGRPCAALCMLLGLGYLILRWMLL